MNKSFIREAIEKRVVEILNPPKNQIKKPYNRLWIAVFGFNVVFFFVDVITSVTVGYLTFWYYGVLVFLAGILPMLAHEALFANPYASRYQRRISGAGFGFSVLAALLVGVMVVIINVLFDSSETGILLEAIAMGLLFFIAVLHGGLLALYFFIDAGIQAVQNAQTAMAKNERQLSNIAMAEAITDEANKVIAKLEERTNKGDAALMGAAMESIAGTNPLDRPN
jgi:hypothetical protein